MVDEITNEARQDEYVVFVRLELYNRDLPCGPRAIRVRLAEHYGVSDVPSERTISRILKRNGLTHRRTGLYAGDGAVDID